MKHRECINYINLDCEKGMCAIAKVIVPIDGEGSEACENFKEAPTCGSCRNFIEPDKYGLGTCKGFEKESWAYGTCGAFTCEQYHG